MRNFIVMFAFLFLVAPAHAVSGGDFEMAPCVESSFCGFSFEDGKTVVKGDADFYLVGSAESSFDAPEIWTNSERAYVADIGESDMGSIGDCAKLHSSNFKTEGVVALEGRFYCVKFVDSGAQGKFLIESFSGSGENMRVQWVYGTEAEFAEDLAIQEREAQIGEYRSSVNDLLSKGNSLFSLRGLGLVAGAIILVAILKFLRTGFRRRPRGRRVEW